MTDRAPARYFPIRTTPFRFQAAFVPFGTDFGNAEVDQQFFQIDSQRQRYLAAKQQVDSKRHCLLARDDAEHRVHARVLAWIQATLESEHPEQFPRPPDSYRGVAAAVQEDLVVMHRRPDGSDAAIMVDVCFPSDWRPERIAGTGFRFIHGPVPGFADTDTQVQAMLGAMIDRGPYVRFVWTLSPDDHLDHHPEEGAHGSWLDGNGFLRVERQVTVPFRDASAALFLIRTYLYPFAELTAEQRSNIARALEAMPADAARYKNFSTHLQDILALLRVTPATR